MKAYDALPDIQRELAAFAGVALLGAFGGAVAKAADASLLTWAADLDTYPAICALALLVPMVIVIARLLERR